MVQRFPGTDLKAEPHISSKIHIWKKNYNSLSQMFSKSGFGMKDNNMIDVEDDVLNAYPKIDTTARTMCFKSWPFYSDWVEIFGKDRAIGEHATGFIDAIQDFLTTGNVESSNETSLTPQPTPNAASSKAAPTPNDGSSTETMLRGRGESSANSKRCGKSKARRISVEDNDPFLARVDEYCDRHDNHMGKIATKMDGLGNGKRENLNPSEKCSIVYDMLEKLEFLTTKEIVDVGRYLCSHDSDLDFFFSIPNEAKIILVKGIMDKS